MFASLLLPGIGGVEMNDPFLVWVYVWGGGGGRGFVLLVFLFLLFICLFFPVAFGCPQVVGFSGNVFYVERLFLILSVI